MTARNQPMSHVACDKPSLDDPRQFPVLDGSHLH